MPVDIALHALANPVQGNHPPAPVLPVLYGQKGLAEAANSDPITVSQNGGAVLCLTATAKLRVDIRLQADVGSLDATLSAVVLVADQPRFFTLGKGTWVLKTAVYA